MPASRIDLRIMRGTEQGVPAADINIVIDVIRAFTVSHVAFSKGAREIFLAHSVDEAFALKALHPDYLLAGEVGGLPIAGFDLDNSPYTVSMAEVGNRTLVQKTTHGVKATLAALNARQIFVTGFSNARQTALHVRHLAASKGYCSINVIASHAADDDDFSCAEFIRDQFFGLGQITPESVSARILNSRPARKFQPAGNIGFDPRDLAFCSIELASDFVMEVDNSPPLARIVKTKCRGEISPAAEVKSYLA